MSESTGFRAWRPKAIYDAFAAEADKYRKRFEGGETALTQDEAVEAYRLVAPLCDPDPDPDKAEKYAAVRRFSYKSERTGRVYLNAESISNMLTAFEAEHAGEPPIGILGEPWERYYGLKCLDLLVSEDLGSFPNATFRELIARACPILDRERPVTRPRGRYNAAINDGRDLFIRWCIEALEGCGLPVTARDGGSLAEALAEVLGVSESAIRKVWEGWQLREPCVNDTAPDDLRMRESLIRRPREYFAVGVRCADCGQAGKVPKYRAGGGSRLCLLCRPPNGSLPDC